VSKFGEIGEHLVRPDLVKAATEALDYCKRHYGGGENLRIRWMEQSDFAYALAKLQETGAKILGIPTRAVERGYEEDPGFYGFVRLLNPAAIFLSTQNDPEHVVVTVGHEFFHLCFGDKIATLEEDEKQAEDFGRRIARELAAERAAEEK
jgi:Zn-dependent peptidase ImmA (M78 family)